MLIKEKSKKLLYLYNRSFWYISHTKAELLKPLGFWNETILILTWLAVNGQRPSWKTILSFYIAVLFFAAIVGKFIVWMGIVKYNSKLGNSQNPELRELLIRVRNIEKKIDPSKFAANSDESTLKD